MDILIVDDNPKIREMIIKVLTRQLREIKTIYECEDGLKACEIYSDKLPDWVIMDIEMKGMDGLKATENIKQCNPEAKVIILSQYDDLFYRHLARKLGAHTYVLKEDLYQIPEIIKIFYNNKTKIQNI